MRRGFTIIELAITLVVLGFVVTWAVPRFGHWLDRLAVMRAEEEVVGFYQRARLEALFRSVRVRVLITGDSLTATAIGDRDSLLFAARGPARHGVTLRASREVIRLYPNGLGLGGANSKIILGRREVLDSVTISRLGRLRRLP
jgi:prepilin-type N-terminal cleavage/methylation domain-containing protein